MQHLTCEVVVLTSTGRKIWGMVNWLEVNWLEVNWLELQSAHISVVNLDDYSRIITFADSGYNYINVV